MYTRGGVSKKSKSVSTIVYYLIPPTRFPRPGPIPMPAAAATATGGGWDEVGRALASLFPLAAVLIGILIRMHSVHHMRWAVRSLLLRYRSAGMEVVGTVLSCEAGPAGEEGGGRVVAEIMYERSVHRSEGAASDRLLGAFTSDRFRHPGRRSARRYVRRCGLSRPHRRGDEVGMLCLPGSPRSAYPAEGIEELLRREEDGNLGLRPRRRHERTEAAAGLALATACLAFAARTAAALPDPALGCRVFLSLLALGEAVPWLYWTDRYLRARRRRFESARPVRSPNKGCGAGEVVEEGECLGLGLGLGQGGRGKKTS